MLAEAVALRERVAELFGSPSWAHHTMDEKMAHDPETVDAFYDDLVPALTKKATEEIAVMAARLSADVDASLGSRQGDDLQLWDWRYYDTQLRRTEYGVDLHAVAAYFPLQQVLDGMLEITGEVFGLEYRPIAGAAVWHPDVRSFTIVDVASGEDVAVVHMDLHPREGKFSHAAAFTLVGGRRLPDGSYRRPVSAIVANLTKPTAERPSLLLHDEVVTLFHEFGHILHQTLTTRRDGAVLGHEHRARLRRGAVADHGALVLAAGGADAASPATTRPGNRSRPSSSTSSSRPATSTSASSTSAQVQFGILDMGLHGPRRPEDGTTADGGRDLDAILRRAESVALFDHVDGTFMPANFGHLLGGYDAGYYGYLWAKVYGDDMFSQFAADGVTTRRSAGRTAPRSSRRAGRVPATEMLEDFLGRPPSNEAFLAGLGIG